MSPKGWLYRGDYSGNMYDICKLILLLLDKLNIQRVILMPHSMGGFITYLFANLYK